MTSVIGTGHPDLALEITPSGAFRRRIRRPDGVELEVELNAYGNINKMGLVGGAETSWHAWESDNRGGRAGSQRNGRVYQTSSSSPVGLTVARTPDERLRTDAMSAQGLPSGALPVPGVGPGSTLSRVASRDSLGRPTQSAFAAGGGLATVTTPRSSHGDVTGLQVQGANGATVLAVSTEVDADGVVLAGTDASGNRMTFSGFDAHPLHLPTSITVTHMEVATGLGSFEEQRSYDAYGRLIGSENQATGKSETWTYDSLGRLRRHSLNSTPAQVWTYEYAHDTDVLTVTERLNGTPIRETVTRHGLLESEMTWFNDGATATATYQHVGGRLASWTDVRGNSWGNVYDPATGWLLSIELTGGSDGPRTAQSFGQHDAEGKPHQVIDQDGFVTQIAYDALGRPVRWTRGSDVEQVALDANGAEVRRVFGVNAGHVIQTEVDALGRPTATWNGTLTTAPDSAGGGIVILERSTYDGAGRVTQRSDLVSGLKETFAYADVLGRLTRYEREVESGGKRLQFTETRTYSDGGGLTVVTISRTIGMPAGGTRTEQHTVTLDVAGRVLARSEAVPGVGASVHTFDYDARGNFISHRPPRGGVTTSSYDEQGRLLKRSEPGGVETRLTNGPDGAVLQQNGPHEHENWILAHDAFGRLTSKTLAATPKVGAATWSYAYLAGGEVVETDPRGFTTRRKLNARGQVETETRKAGQDERITAFTYDGPWLASATTELGGWRQELRRERHDDRGRARTEIEEWSDDGRSYEYRTTVDWNGTLSAQVNQTWNLRTVGTTSSAFTLQLDSLGNSVRREQGGLADVWHYDAAGQLNSAQPAGVRTPREYTYTQGYLTSESFGPESTGYTYFGDGRLKSVTEPSGRVRTLEYDDRGLVSRETYGSGIDVVTSSYTYDGGGNRETVTHGVQSPAVWNYEYGPLGELTSVIQPGGLGVFTYSYFPDRNLKEVQPPSGSGTAAQSFDYDSLGREVLRGRGSSKWATDWSGGTGTTTNTGASGSGDTVVRRLDGRGRLASVTYVLGPSSSVLGDLDASDLAGGAYHYNGVDQLVSAVEVRRSGDLTNNFEYDARNRPTRVQRGSHLVEYSYQDTGSRSVRVTSPGGNSTYSFDALGRLNRVQSSQGPTATIGWEPGGSRMETVVGSDVFERYCHDGAGRIASVTAASTDLGCISSGAGEVFTRFEYGYDEHGNRTEERSFESGANAVTAYGYDVAGRLTGVRYPDGKGVLYRLAPDGTRLGEKVVSNHGGALGPGAFQSANADLKNLEYTPDMAGGLSVRDLLVPGQPPVVLEVDSAGQVVRKSEPSGVTNYHWDPAGRLTKVTKGASSILARYVYDFGGLRRSATTQHGTSEYVWSGEELIEEGLATGSKLLHLAGPAGVVSVGTERVLHDGLGSAVARKAPAGEVRRFQFDAWGNYRGDGGAEPRRDVHWVHRPLLRRRGGAHVRTAAVAGHVDGEVPERRSSRSELLPWHAAGAKSLDIRLLKPDEIHRSRRACGERGDVEVRHSGTLRALGHQAAVLPKR